MGWTDKFMPLSQFNMLLTERGYEPIQLKQQYLMCTIAPEIANTDFEDVTVTLNGITCTWAESTTAYLTMSIRI